MSAFSLKHALGLEKPHSSITDWVDILTGPSYADEAYDGIPELVDSINLQGTGPTEASRAIRKKLKHGSSHQQYRALVLLKALVENCGHKFQTSFADGQLTDAIKHLGSDPSTDQKVKKKLLSVLASWNAQFKNDPYMTVVANLYKQTVPSRPQADNPVFGQDSEWEKRRQEKEEAKMKAKKEKEEAKERERQRKEQDERQRIKDKTRRKRAPFDFEKEKPQVINSIANASQASSNLINAITLVNREKESLQENERVQDCLAKAKAARKLIVRYIQLVENEELIGTLIETNDRIIAALEMYDQLTAAANKPSEDTTEGIREGLAGTHINSSESEVNKLQSKQRAAVERARQSGYREESGSPTNLHPDLQDLSFGALGSSSNNLPNPMQPSARVDDNDSQNDRWGSLSDYSDYESSDEERHNARASSSGRRDYVDVSDDSEDAVAGSGGKATNKGKSVEVDDPFADPFTDDAAVDPSKRW